VKVLNRDTKRLVGEVGTAVVFVCFQSGALDLVSRFVSGCGDVVTPLPVAAASLPVGGGFVGAVAAPFFRSRLLGPLCFWKVAYRGTATAVDRGDPLEGYMDSVAELRVSRLSSWLILKSSFSRDKSSAIMVV